MKFIDVPAEQTAAVTDGFLAFLALAGIFYLRGLGHGELWKIHVWSWAFGFIALSAALGAVVHGFKISDALKRLIWEPLNLALGLAVSLFVVGVVYDLWGYPTARWTLPLMLGTGGGFYLITRLNPGIFFIFLIYEGLALLFALGAYGWLAVQGQLKGAVLMTAGVFLSIVAAAIQAKQSASIRVIWEFDHNGIFHLVQMAGLVLLLAGLRAGLLPS